MVALFPRLGEQSGVLELESALALLNGPRAQCPHFSPAASQGPKGRFGSGGIRHQRVGSIHHSPHLAMGEQVGTGEQGSLCTGPGVMRDCRLRGVHTASCLDSVLDAAQAL